MDCSACGSSGYTISGDLNLIQTLILKTDARYIIVVEKVFLKGTSSNRISSFQVSMANIFLTLDLFSMQYFNDY